MNASMPESAGLFPLRLTAFEQFMLADDTPDYPMTFFIEIGVTGKLDRSAFEAACKTANERHPLLSSIVVRSWGRLHWVPASSFTIINWCETATGMPSHSERCINLRTNPGVRIWVQCGPNSCRIVFQFHHASTDGIGAIQFIGDVIAFYGVTTAENAAERPKVMDLDLRSLRRRGDRWEKGKHPILFGTAFAVRGGNRIGACCDL